MKILALDTSGPVAAVALAEEETTGQARLIGGFRLQSGFTHSQTLMPMLEKMKDLADIDLAEIDYIAVASGPGSFTGLRIGASAAKGLAFALEKQIVPVPTLDAMAYRMWGAYGLVCPLMDARRQQVYTGVYAFEQTLPFMAHPAPRRGMTPERADCGNGQTDAPHADPLREREGGYEKTQRMTRLLAPSAMAVTELVTQVNDLYRERFRTESETHTRQEMSAEDAAAATGSVTGDASAKETSGACHTPVVYLMGDGVPVYADALRAGLSVPYVFVPFHNDRQCAEALCALAFQYVAEGKTVDADAFAPEYLRPSQAERTRARENGADGEKRTDA